MVVQMKRDTIGYRQYVSRVFFNDSAFEAFHGRDLNSARYKGLALGHAFRAAELVYDLGQKHACHAFITIIGGKVPCDCGSRNASWHGPESGLRTYCCEACWSPESDDAPSGLADYL